MLPEKRFWRFLKIFVVLAHDLESVEWKINGAPIMSKRMELNDDYLRAFNALHRNVNLDSPVNTVQLDLETFKKRCFFLSLDLPGDGCQCKCYIFCLHVST